MHAENAELTELLEQLARDRDSALLEPVGDVRGHGLGEKSADRIAYGQFVVGVSEIEVEGVECGKLRAGGGAHRAAPLVVDVVRVAGASNSPAVISAAADVVAR
ncbi:Uncharacterised protein [Mycobacteroides abscessus subsp. abscessus]|nr:Uncharacterised protein [Mycobacteroides abscessus subsp. abscessus]